MLNKLKRLFTGGIDRYEDTYQGGYYEDYEMNDGRDVYRHQEGFSSMQNPRYAYPDNQGLQNPQQMYQDNHQQNNYPANGQPQPHQHQRTQHQQHHMMPNNQGVNSYPYGSYGPSNMGHMQSQPNSNMPMQHSNHIPNQQDSVVPLNQNLPQQDVVTPVAPAATTDSVYEPQNFNNTDIMYTKSNKERELCILERGRDNILYISTLKHNKSFVIRTDFQGINLRFVSLGELNVDYIEEQVSFMARNGLAKSTQYHIESEEGQYIDQLFNYPFPVDDFGYATVKFMQDNKTEEMFFC